MGRVTSGKIEYGETRRIAEYENKKATVTLDFSIDEGEDADDIITGIQEACITRCHHMLGLKTGKMPKPEPAPAALEPAPVAPKSPPKKLGRPKKVAPDPAEVTDEEDDELPMNEAAPVKDEPEDDDDLGDLLGETKKEPEPELTDKVIIDATSKAAARVGKASLVKPLVVKFTGNKAGTVSMIPMAVRAEYLAALAGIERPSA